jgi:XTP/dITP diphosphohydrolase
MPAMQITVASTNPHKLDEIRAAYDGSASQLEWIDFDEAQRRHGGPVPEPEEDQPTFEGNAALKARYYAECLGLICIADDSGIEVDALDSRPGVRSARYSGVTGPRSEVDPANNRKLLEALADVPAESRTARFVCAMCLVIPPIQRDAVPGFDRLRRPGEDHVQLVVRGEVAGRILLPDEAADPKNPAAGRGAHGFGYDPLFLLPANHRFAGRTTAELSPAEKNAISHRGVASRRLLQAMQRHGLLPPG